MKANRKEIGSNRMVGLAMEVIIGNGRTDNYLLEDTLKMPSVIMDVQMTQTKKLGSLCQVFWPEEAAGY